MLDLYSSVVDGDPIFKTLAFRFVFHVLKNDFILFPFTGFEICF
jgi:hypothetical protein